MRTNITKMEFIFEFSFMDITAVLFSLPTEPFVFEHNTDVDTYTHAHTFNLCTRVHTHPAHMATSKRPSRHMTRHLEIDEVAVDSFVVDVNIFSH